MGRGGRILIRALALAGAVLVLGGLPQPADTKLWLTVYDAGHAPLFGFVALVLLSLIRIVRPGRAGLQPYLFAFLIAMALGGVAELVQFFGMRDADPGDLLRNGAGAASFLTLARVMEKGEDGRAVVGSGLLRIGAGVLAGALFLAVFIPVGARIIDYRGRDASFPVLCELESRWDRTFVKPVSSGLQPETLPPEMGEAPGRRVGRWVLYSRPYPGLALEEPFPDWSGHKELRFTIWSDQDRPVEMTLMAEDLRHRPGTGDRARVRFRVEPGRNRIRIPLEEIRLAPPNRSLEMDQVAMLMLYTRRPEEPFTLWIDSIRLE